MPAQRDEPSAPPQAENDLRQGIVVALRATGRLVPAFRRGMSLPYGTGAELLRSGPTAYEIQKEFTCYFASDRV